MFVADTNSPTADSPGLDTSGPSGGVSDAVDTDTLPSSAGTTNTPTKTTDEPTSLFEAALRSVVPEKAPEGATPPEGEAKGADAPAAAGEPAAGAPSPDSAPAEADDVADEAAALAGVTSIAVRKRISRLIEQRNLVRGQFAQIEPDAIAWQQHREFLVQNRVSPEDARLLYDVAASLSRGDFATFLAAVTPYVEAAQMALGQRLPADIQRQVDDGAIPEDVARELVRTRSEAETAKAQAALTQQEAQRASQANVTAQLRGAVAEWETRVRASDPDFDTKAGAIQRHAQALVATRGLPRTREDAVAMAQEAYNEVSQLVAKSRPTPVPTRPTPASAHVPNPGTPEPKTLMEAVQLGLRRARA